MPSRGLPRKILRGGKRSYLLDNAKIRKWQLQKKRRDLRLLRRPRSIRTAQNPVRVLAVCARGESGRDLADLFAKFLKQHRVSAVSTVPVALFHHPFVDKTPEELRGELRGADIIIFPFLTLTEGGEKRLKQASPKQAIFLNFREWRDPNRFSDLLRLIKENFDLR